MSAEKCDNNPKNLLEGLELHGNLSDRDKELIVEQCVHQNATSKEQLLGFAHAYAEAKDLASDTKKLESLQSEDVLELILRYAKLIESDKNKNGYRKVPAGFSSGQLALDPDAIEGAMQRFAEFYANGDMKPEEAYKWFEEIHPFFDGNGRVGDLLWKLAVARETKTWPESLPPKVF